MNDSRRGSGRRRRLAGPVLDRAPASRQQVAQLQRRVAELETEMQEARRLNRRLAELTDVVQELLVPLADRDEDKVKEYLERYSSSL